MANLPGSAGELDGRVKLPSAQDLDVTVLAFAQWLSEMKLRSNSSLQQMLAEMGIIRNGITSNNTDLTEFKRNTATVQQQMQSQISDLRDKLTDAYTEIANTKKTKSQFEQEVHAECQSLSEQLQFKTLELETLKKAYAHTHQQLQQQIIQLQQEANELRMRNDDASRQNHQSFEQNVNKVSEVEMASQYANNELKRLRSDHDLALTNVADNMNRWNETLRDLSKEFHDFQKVMTVNQQRLQSGLWEVQGKVGIASPPDSGGRLEPAVGSPAGRQAMPQAAPGGAAIRGQSPQAAATVGTPAARRASNQQPGGMMSPYTSAAPQPAPQPGIAGQPYVVQR
eukprot:CAMPEP_0197648430 /NCGR_PEP_ID=MMETSP1338-20131121/27746_1 /TAXON_ID=43686 ORGANISM="Pelagodinium beii, Strain RCC1491" /NCGR_SAMPLE_ID=MMETSP1338 /ASSEMBLY_ACC=CAM_ASM_000754 /LENGTH=339 /DNA_ID=CAMNT_0043222421 /DNA_START=36 /DNA_END=1055 /DNA_ORIENTATION=+